MKAFAKSTVIAAALIGAFMSAPASATNNSQRAFGLTDDNRLVRFRTSTPSYTHNIGHLSGFQMDVKLIGIDFRVQNGLLYGVGDKGGIYTIDTKNAALTFVDRLTIAPVGASFGVDFNPAANALRVVSDTGQNLRHPFATLPATTVMDGTLSYTPPTPATGVAGSAYTNNDLSTNTGTTLFALDTNLDQIAIQAPANNGTLSATGLLGVDAGAIAGFDIFSRVNRDGDTVENRGFASLFVDGKYRFYRINLLTGDARFVGRFDKNVVDIAISLDN